MSFRYYNQYNYKDVPYWSASHPSATIASAGCGVCCASMVLSVFGLDLDPRKMAKIAQDIGARVDGGTDMGKLSSHMKTQYKLNLSKYDDIYQLKKDISSGKVAIANVGGDRTGYKGVFSNGGHYIVVYGLTSKAEPVIYDPGFYQGKYDSSYRSSKVTVGEKNQLYSTWEVLSKDCATRTPRYYVFSKEEAQKKMTLEEAKKIIKEKCKLSNNTMLYLWSYRYGDDLLLKLAKAMI